MIRPTIVPYTEEWREPMRVFARTVDWQEGVAEWPWTPALTLLAVHHGRVVGFVAGWAGQPVGIIDSLVVIPDLRGQGIGVFLWAAMMKRLAEHGVQRVRGITANGPLQRMLERCGYVCLAQGAIVERSLTDA